MSRGAESNASNDCCGGSSSSSRGGSLVAAVPGLQPVVLQLQCLVVCCGHPCLAICAQLGLWVATTVLVGEVYSPLAVTAIIAST